MEAIESFENQTNNIDENITHQKNIDFTTTTTTTEIINENIVVEIATEENIDYKHENEILQSTIDNFKLQFTQIQDVLTQKDNIISLQKRELEVVDKEKMAIKRELEISRKEKELAVVNYAVAEKKLIDFKVNNDQLSKRLKDSMKETEGHSTRLKFVCGERERANRDLRKSTNELEALKIEMSTLETKLKWNQVKLKQDVQTKAAFESKITELTVQIQQMNENRQQNLDMVKYEEKETEAQLILYKHSCETKEKENVTLHAKITQIKKELEEITSKYNKTIADYTELKTINSTNDKIIDTLEQSNETLDKQLIEITADHKRDRTLLENVQVELNEAQVYLMEIKDLKENYEEQLVEIDKMRQNEEQLMLFTKELTEKSVLYESRLTLSNAKSAALVLENEKIKEIYEDHKQYVIEMEENLTKTMDKHRDEIIGLELIESDLKQERDKSKLDLENALGELDATKRKHSQVVKELLRDVAALRTKIEPKKIISDEQLKGPSKKTLIDRIVRLQRQLARQTEKIEFLENHCAALIIELKSKS